VVQLAAHIAEWNTGTLAMMATPHGDPRRIDEGCRSRRNDISPPPGRRRYRRLKASPP
jgi:hypothetical protein